MVTSVAITGGCFLVGAISAYQFKRMKNTMPVSALHFYVSAVFFTSIGIIRLYNALSESSYFQTNALLTRTFVRE